MYTVYKITNNLNQKYYIGVHKTDNPNDGYMGSGKAIKEAIKVHGRENFSKEILFVTEDQEEAYSLEKQLTVDFYDRNNYNMRIGGIGGFTKENSKKGYESANWTSEMLSENGKKNVKKFTTDQLSENGRKGGLALKGRPKSEAHKKALREAWLKKKLSQ
jgi:hypothetical protein